MSEAESTSENSMQDDSQESRVQVASDEDKEGTDSKQEKAPQKKVDLLKMNVDSETSALNILIGFIGIAQRRGAYAVNESAKVYEAIKFFMQNTES